MSKMCDHDFHLDECNACGMVREDRDAPMIEVISAVNYGDGYQEAVRDLTKRLPDALRFVIGNSLTWLYMWRFDPQDEDPWPRLAEAVIEALNDEEGLAEAFRRVRQSGGEV